MKSMKWARLVISLGVIFLCISSDLFAFFDTGNDLVLNMREYEKANANVPNSDYFKAAYYMGFVTGVCDATSHFYDAPANLTKNQLFAIVAKYLKENPEKWSQPGSLLVIEALRKSFPKR